MDQQITQKQQLVMPLNAYTHSYVNLCVAMHAHINLFITYYSKKFNKLPDVCFLKL